MQLQPVYNHNKLGQNDLWATIRSQVCGHTAICEVWTDFCSKVVNLLDEREIEHSSIDLVCFSWVEEKADDEENTQDSRDDGDDEDYRDEAPDDKDDGDDEDNGYDRAGYINTILSSNEKVVTTPVTIWVGVLPNTLTSETAFHSSSDILDLLKEHGIFDIDVAFRESIVKSYSGPELFAPVPDLDPLKAVIDTATTALGLPIAGLKTLNIQGTMGFYFKAGQDLYAVTARHVLFPEDQSNNPYFYRGGLKKRSRSHGRQSVCKFFKIHPGSYWHPQYPTWHLGEASWDVREEGG